MTDKTFKKTLRLFWKPLNNGTNEGGTIKDFKKTFKKPLTNEKTCAIITV